MPSICVCGDGAREVIRLHTDPKNRGTGAYLLLTPYTHGVPHVDCEGPLGCDPNRSHAATRKEGPRNLPASGIEPCTWRNAKRVYAGTLDSLYKVVYSGVVACLPVDKSRLMQRCVTHHTAENNSTETPSATTQLGCSRVPPY
jgi:hypothetical protein